MKLDSFFAQHQIFTVNELTAWLSKEFGYAINHSTLHNSLAYHQKQGHILRIRRGLYYSIPKGGNGNLEVDLNYMFRMPLYGIHKKRSHSIGTRKTKEIPLLDLHELGAGKLSALFGRHASRAKIKEG